MRYLDGFVTQPWDYSISYSIFITPPQSHRALKFTKCIGINFQIRQRSTFLVQGNFISQLC